MSNYDVEMRGTLPLTWSVAEQLDGTVHVFLGLMYPEDVPELDPSENSGCTIAIPPEELPGFEDDILWAAMNRQTVRMVNEYVLPAFLIPLNVALKEMRTRIQERHLTPPTIPFDQDNADHTDPRGS